MPLIAFLLYTHARLQDNACAMSHDGSRKSTWKSTKSAEKSGNQREIRKSGISYAETAVSDPSYRTMRISGSSTYYKLSLP